MPFMTLPAAMARYEENVSIWIPGIIDMGDFFYFTSGHLSWMFLVFGPL